MYQKLTVSKKSEKADPDGRVKMYNKCDLWLQSSESIKSQNFQQSKVWANSWFLHFRNVDAKLTVSYGFISPRSVAFFVEYPIQKKTKSTSLPKVFAFVHWKAYDLPAFAGHVDEGDMPVSEWMMIYKHFSAPCVPPTNDKPGIMDPLQTHLRQWCEIWNPLSMESVLYLFCIQRSSFSQTASLMETYEKKSEEFRLPKWQKPTHHGLKKPVAPILTWYEFRFQQLGATVLRNASIKIYFCRVKHFIHPKFVESSAHIEVPVHPANLEVSSTGGPVKATSTETVEDVDVEPEGIPRTKPAPTVSQMRISDRNLFGVG